MKIKTIELFHIEIPLKTAFSTAKETLRARETIIIKVIDEHGMFGFGEVVAFSTPFYTNETLEISKQVLLDKYFPIVLEREISHPFDIHEWFGLDFPMAIAGLENALLDLYAKNQSKNAISLVFGEKLADSVGVGIVLGDMDGIDLCRKIEKDRQDGCTRFKVKIKPQDGLKKLQMVRSCYPEIQLLADANKSYKIAQIDDIRKLDGLNLLCIEEPFDTVKIEDYMGIQNIIRTPICLDESIQTIEQLKKAIQLKAFKVLNIKIGRLGGVYYAKQAVELCRKNGIKYWIGSMIESGISKILHVQMAGLGDVYIPGDLSDSRRYFEMDLIIPDICSVDGIIKVPTGPGIGVQVDEKKLWQVTKEARIQRQP